MSVPVTGTIVAYAGGAYPVIDPIYGVDGMRSVADATARNAIGTFLRRKGMLVALQSDLTVWQLNTASNTGTNADWTAFGSGGSLPSGSNGQILKTDGATPFFSSIIEMQGGSHATGTKAVVIGQGFSDATGTSAIATGNVTTASGDFSATFGDGGTADAYGSMAVGSSSYAHGQYSFAEGNAEADGVMSHAGGFAKADLRLKFAWGDHFSGGNVGDSQYSILQLSKTTTDATPVNLTISGGADLPLVRSGAAYGFKATIVAQKSDGSATLMLMRTGLIKNVSGTTSLVGSISTLGADINSTSWTIAITADDTNDALQIQATGQTSTTIHWTCTLECTEVK